MHLICNKTFYSINEKICVLNSNERNGNYIQLHHSLK